MARLVISRKCSMDLMNLEDIHVLLDLEPVKLKVFDKKIKK